MMTNPLNFHTQKSDEVILMSYEKIEFKFHAPVIVNLLNLLRKKRCPFPYLRRIKIHVVIAANYWHPFKRNTVM